MFKEKNIPNIFKMEVSFCGAEKWKFKDMRYSSKYFKLDGLRLLETLIDYCKIDVH